MADFAELPVQRNSSFFVMADIIGQLPGGSHRYAAFFFFS